MTENQDITRIPPQSIDSEKAVLGSMMQEDAAAGKALEILSEQCFYLDAHKFIFRAMAKLDEEHKPIDQLSVTEQLSQMKLLDDAGGAAVIADLINRVPSAANIEYYSNIVREKYILRTIIKTSNEMIDKAFSENEETDIILDNAQQLIFQLRENSISRDFIDIKSILHPAVELIESLSQHHGDVIGIPSGFSRFDSITNGFQNSDLIIIAGRPSMGKTALALSMLRNMAVDHGVHVGFFSLEMSQEGIANRLLSMESAIDHQKLRRGKIPGSLWQNLIAAAAKINDAHMYFDFTPNLNVLDMRSRARRLKSRVGKLDIIFVDYLQIAKANINRNDSRQQEVAMISQQLKALAKEMNIPVVALSQLSRAPEQRGKDSEPKLSDLRDSGAIEQDADIVMFIHRKSYYSKSVEDEGKAEIIIAKHRNGPTGIVPLTFRDNIVRFFEAPFENYAEEAEEQAF
ncbi:MAG: replicative DNA helicase [Candidatus Neomarinimicrobiota bacterium]|nr:replicative DNA helicase [Candidatus Neomarinimicrobiota bacterium]MDD3965856.1 replicative DNA helicase [Candidatus Neomarinimicrobiota bacterium]